MASQDQHELSIQVAFKNRIRPRLVQAALSVMTEPIYPNSVYSANRIAEANSVLNAIDQHLDRYALAVAVNATIQTAYTTARNLNGENPEADILAGIAAISDNDIDFVLASSINPIGKVTARDIKDSRKPINVDAKDISDTSATIVWDEILGKDSYKIRHRIEGGNMWIDGTATVEELAIASLNPDTFYEVQVSTVYTASGSQESSFSDIITFKTRTVA